jgi:hypothetical protein
VADFCEHGIDASDVMKVGAFLDQLSNYQFLRRTLLRALCQLAIHSNDEADSQRNKFRIYL